MPNCTVGVMNGLFYLDEIFYSENSPYLYGIDTLSSINQSKPIRTMEHYVNIMLDSGFTAALYDEREVMQLISRQGEKGPEWKYDLLPVYGI